MSVMPNELIHETSPYLLQHAHNPVAWHAWGEAAFAQARAEDKLVFLSVGYSTCHWCHVMEHESFENPAIAGIMNDHFINIKVDREERPDLDATYMAFVQASTGQGGWPMSVWLTPDGNPLVGGTYFPPADSHGRPGFPRLCNELARLWSDERSRLQTHAAEMLDDLHRSADHSPPSSGLAGPQIFENFLNSCQAQFDSEWGGFGGAPKFPRPVVVRALMQLAERYDRHSAQGAAAWSMCEHTLRGMALGGIHDHLGGGFHRYAVDRYWHIPHYEKMLYDQAQLALAYLDGWQISNDPSMRDVAEGIFRYLVTSLIDRGGAFHAAEDADSLPAPTASRSREGAYWTWDAAEIAALLDARDAAIFTAAYGIEAAGNARPESDPHGALTGQNTLFRARPDAELAAIFDCPETDIRERLRATSTVLLETRARRPLPHRDDKIVTAWNGLAIAALAHGARVLGRDDLAAAAVAAARFIRRELWDGQCLYRSFRVRRSSVAAFPADYVSLIAGLIELHAVDPAGGWLDWAHTLQQILDAGFWDSARCGYVMRPALGGKTLFVIREDYDGAEPSPNHLAAENLLKLACLLDSPAYLERAESLLRGGSAVLESQPFAAPLLVAALDLHQRGVMKFQVPSAAAPEVLDKLRTSYHPRAVHTATTGSIVTLCEGVTCRNYT
jgi:uncharacterized protein YyaL (SSP411 family)